MTSMVWWISRVVLLAVGITTTPVLGQELVGPPGNAQSRKNVPSESADQKKASQSAWQPAWHYGGFVDLGYSLNLNHLFRNRSTTPRVNELDINGGDGTDVSSNSDRSRAASVSVSS